MHRKKLLCRKKNSHEIRVGESQSHHNTENDNITYENNISKSIFIPYNIHTPKKSTYIK